jgi:hypothetical protein
VGMGPSDHERCTHDLPQVYTSAYDCTIRHMSFTSGISEEIYATGDTLISGFDFSNDGHVMWISDNRHVTPLFRWSGNSELRADCASRGGLTYRDLREAKHKAKRFQLSEKQKLGCVSLNPRDGWSLLASCNDRSLKCVTARALKRSARISLMQVIADH